MTVDVRVYFDAEAIPGATAWRAESPDAPGYVASAESFEELRTLVYDGLRFFFESDDVEITGILARESIVPTLTAKAPELQTPLEAENRPNDAGALQPAGGTIASSALQSTAA